MSTTAAPPLALPSYLVAAMRANPADDGLRLQVADFFDENGQPERAEFVRVQVELANIDPNPGPNHRGKWADLRRREREIFAATYRQLSAGLWPVPPLLTADVLDMAMRAGDLQCAFRRGFLESVTCPAADWLEHGDALYAREPVTAVTLTTWPMLYIFRRPGRMHYEVSLDPNDAVGYLQGNTPDNRAAGERVLSARWPGVTFTLPPELRAGILMGRVTAEGEAEDTPPDHGTTDWDVAEGLSAAPPDNARRRGGHSRMPGWLAEQRNRPGHRR